MTAPRALVVPFTKMNGAGNDFVVVDNRWFHFSDSELAALARQACPRRTGVGADGLLALDAPATEAVGVDFRMRYRNADGSLATMCGNGARCLARFAAQAGLGVASPTGATALTFDTDGGRYHALVPSAGDVTLDVPPPRDARPARLAGGDTPDGLTQIWTGTEHAVLFVADVDAEDLEATARPIRHDAAFQPTGTNVNLVAVADPGSHLGAARVAVRTFEKGVEGETLACGTGALASALAARLTGRVTADRVEVAMPGGTLHVGFRMDGASITDVTLAGPAEVVFEGTLELAS